MLETTLKRLKQIPSPFFFLDTLIKKWTLLVKYSAQLNFRGWSSGTEWFSTAGFSFYAKLRQRASHLDGRIVGKLQHKSVSGGTFCLDVSLPKAVLLCCPFSFWRTHARSLYLPCLLRDETFQILHPLLWRWTSKLWKTKPCSQFSAECFSQLVYCLPRSPCWTGMVKSVKVATAPLYFCWQYVFSTFCF